MNGWLALFLLNGRKLRPLIVAGVTVLAIIGCVLAYGLFRMSQQTTTPGPVVMVVQPNYKQSNNGEKGAEQDEIEAFHLRMTEQSLRQHPGVDLVVWSETMMGALNEEGRTLRELPISSVWEDTHRRIMDLARTYHAAFLVGGVYYAKWDLKHDARGDRLVPADRRNVSYFYDASGRQSPVRYDKVHLVPFGETLPFKTALPPLYHLFLALSPYTEEYTLTAGPPDALTVFELKPDWRFVTPICFEDIDPALVHRMFQPTGDRKRADFIVNITNDGWFLFNEMPQHFQAAIFRSIENRVPTARSVNTGISGFVDSVGRKHDLLPTHAEGTSIARLELDHRVTFYSRHGDWFAIVGEIITAILTALLLWREIIRWKSYRTRRSPTAA
jgi:apolipoprotein N-acyltransferase